jgi:hypothetical protein
MSEYVGVCRSHVGVCWSNAESYRSMSETCRRHVGDMSEETHVASDDKSYKGDRVVNLLENRHL